MDRRDFIKKGAAAFALAGLPPSLQQLAEMRKRVGLIGTGWYGKSDLLRLVQVAPVEVVSLCDVDRHMVARGRRPRRRRDSSRRRSRESTATIARCCASATSTSC